MSSASFAIQSLMLCLWTCEMCLHKQGCFQKKILYKPARNKIKCGKQCVLKLITSLFIFRLQTGKLFCVGLHVFNKAYLNKQRILWKKMVYNGVQKPGRNASD